MESEILLEHIISKKGLDVDINKVKDIFAPTYVREVWGFLGCIKYYKRFIEGYAKQATPLTKSEVKIYTLR